LGYGQQGQVVKICFLNTVAYEYAMGGRNAIGGSERNIWFHSRALAAAGWSVRIGVRGSLRPKERNTIEGVEYVGLTEDQPLISWYRFLVSERPDWLYWGGADHLWGPLVEIAKLAGVRTVFHTAFDADVQPSRAVFRRPRWWPLYAWGLWRTDRIFVQHTGQLSMLHPWIQSKACVLPKVCPLAPGMLSHNERQEYIAWVASMRQHKRPDLLVNIARSMPGRRFVVCGEPTTYQSAPGYGGRIVKALAELPNVEYRGRVSPDDAMIVISNAALLLCTSDEEGFPNTFTQAWSSGTPVVTLRVDPDGIIEKMKLGAVSKSVDGAVQDIELLMKSSQHRDEIAERARLYVLEHHNEGSVVGIFNQVLGNSQPRSGQSDVNLKAAKSKF
jgi:glycosyltransferase involved in cell wall biosynthesis